MNPFHSITKWFPYSHPNLAGRYKSNFIPNGNNKNEIEMENEMINMFAEKQGLEYLDSPAPGIHRFSSGLIVSEDDIAFDLHHNVKAGLIRLYMAEATNGYVKDFTSWLKYHNYEF